VFGVRWRTVAFMSLALRPECLTSDLLLGTRAELAAIGAAALPPRGRMARPPEHGPRGVIL